MEHYLGLQGTLGKLINIKGYNFNIQSNIVILIYKRLSFA